MTNPAGKSNDGALRLDFDRRVMLQFRGSVVTSDAGLAGHHRQKPPSNGKFARPKADAGQNR